MDSFGTEAQFNFNQYKEKVDGGSMGAFGRYNLNLRQFQTMFRKIYLCFHSNICVVFYYYLMVAMEITTQLAFVY